MEEDKAYLQTLLEKKLTKGEDAVTFVPPTLPEKIELQQREPESIDLVEQPEIDAVTLNPEAAIQSASKQTGMSEQEIRDLLK